MTLVFLSAFFIDQHVFFKTQEKPTLSHACNLLVVKPITVKPKLCLVFARFTIFGFEPFHFLYSYEIVWLIYSFDI